MTKHVPAGGDDAIDLAQLRAERDACKRDLEDALKQLSAMESLQAEHDRWRDLAARSQADLQNAKARLERDQSDLRKFAAEGLLLRILPTLDNFQRAFAHIPPDLAEKEWVKGVLAIERELMRQMGELGLKKLSVLHEPFNASRHEVLLTVPGEEGKVMEVLEDGYELHGKVIRPAKVKVGSGQTHTS